MQRGLLIHLGLALTWAALSADFSRTTLLAGVAVGYLVLWIVGPLIDVAEYVRRLRFLLELLGLFLWALLLASLEVTLDVLTPGHREPPAVLAVPLDVDSDAEVVVLSLLLSLTPGSLVLDLAEDRRTLFVHVMHVRGNDLEARRRALKHRFEAPVRRAFGPWPRVGSGSR